MIPPLGIASHPARILIVDDDRRNREHLEVALASQDLVLLKANSGEEALAMVSQQPPDLILLDVMLPGLNGYEVAAKLKADVATRSIPIILITALDDHNARMFGLSAGAEDFLSKPIDSAELSVRVRNLLRLKANADHHDQYGQMLEAEVISGAAELVESERLYRSTFDAAPVGIVHVGLDGKWLRVNRCLCDLLGYSCDELQKVGLEEVAESDEATSDSASFRAMAAGTMDRHVVDEKQYRKSDGSVVWARVNMSVHRDSAGEPQHFILVIEDITARRTLDAQMRQANKMDAMGQLASGVAHDFNNLLSVILGFAELLALDVATAQRHGTEIGEIITAAKRASVLTRQLLAFSRQQVQHIAPLDVNALISNMTGMIGMLLGNDIDLAVTLSPDVSMALADHGQLEQVVMNLVVNARDAMPNGGHLTIETMDAQLEGSLLEDEEITAGPYVMLAVTDTGIGMTSGTRRRLFEPFFTTKSAENGTGLGLSTSHGIVKQSKGYIQVQSEAGRGSTFSIYLPRFEIGVSRPAEPLPPPDLPNSRTSPPSEKRPYSARSRPRSRPEVA